MAKSGWCLPPARHKDCTYKACTCTCHEGTTP